MKKVADIDPQLQQTDLESLIESKRVMDLGVVDLRRVMGLRRVVNSKRCANIGRLFPSPRGCLGFKKNVSSVRMTYLRASRNLSC